MTDTSDDRYGLMTFTGPAGRTYFDKNGALQTAAENEIREEYDPLTGAYRGMLIEQSGTNQLGYSNDFAKWTEGLSSNLGITKDNAVSPSGKTDATRIIESNSNEAQYIQSRESASGTITASVYAKHYSGNVFLQIVGFGIVNNNNSPNFDLQRGIAYASPNTGIVKSVGMDPVGGGWYRCWCLISVNGSAGMSIAISNNSGAIGDSGYVRQGDGSSGFYIWGAQVESGAVPSSYIPTNGSPVTRARDDARFTDLSVFNNFERGAFVVEFQTSDLPASNAYENYVLMQDKNNRLVLMDRIGTGNIRTYTNVVSPNINLGHNVDGFYDRYKYAFSFGEFFSSCVNAGNILKSGECIFDRTLDLRLGVDWSGYIKDIQFYPETLTDDQMRLLTTRDATTVIGDCPDGGYYDYSDLSTLFVESDESGIGIRDRTSARVGDPVGVILDKSGHGNHMTASTDDRRGILRSDGKLYWIERDGTAIYGFDCSYEYSFTFFSGLYTDNESFILLNGEDGAGGDSYTTVYQYNTSTSAVFTGFKFFHQRAFFNGVLKHLSTRKDALDALTDPVLIREFYHATSNTRRLYYGGRSGFGITGNDYGFAWAARLSEDDAEIVERDMRKNMPPL